MAYLHLFDTKSAHDAVYNGQGYSEPWVGYITADTTVTYNKVIDYKNIVGSIIYATSNGTIKATSREKWSASLGTPIGVVVIPASHMSDGKCRAMSLCNMSYVTPEAGTLGTGNTNASTNGTNLMWGVRDTDTSLTNYTKVQSKGSGMIENFGYLPSDFIKGKTSIDIDGDDTYSVTTLDNSVDTETAWWTEIGEDCAWGCNDGDDTCLAVSPYLADGTQNPAYLTAGQVLSDMNGKSNTSVLVNLSAIKNTYTSGAFENVQANYPAAFACNLFSTVGTSQGDWYLPSMGELAYLFVREGTINQSLAALGNSAVQVGNLTNATSSFGSWCWSSSEYSSNASWGLNYNGNVGTNSKGRDYINLRVRSFAAF